MDKAIANCPHFDPHLDVKPYISHTLRKYKRETRTFRRKDKARSEEREKRASDLMGAPPHFSRWLVCVRRKELERSTKKVSGIYQKRNKTCTQ